MPTEEWSDLVFVWVLLKDRGADVFRLNCHQHSCYCCCFVHDMAIQQKGGRHWPKTDANIQHWLHSNQYLRYLQHWRSSAERPGHPCLANRPLFHTVEERPLAMCDFFLLTRETSYQPIGHRASIGEIHYIKYHENQKWYWISQQAPNELRPRRRVLHKHQS